MDALSQMKGLPPQVRMRAKRLGKVLRERLRQRSSAKALAGK
jgi:hypothetical protein